MFINLDSAGLYDDILCSNVTVDFKGEKIIFREIVENGLIK